MFCVCLSVAFRGTDQMRLKIACSWGCSVCLRLSFAGKRRVNTVEPMVKMGGTPQVVAILHANNYRDIESDKQGGRRLWRRLWSYEVVILLQKTFISSYVYYVMSLIQRSFRVVVLMEEIWGNHLGCIKPCNNGIWVPYHLVIAGFLPSTEVLFWLMMSCDVTFCRFGSKADIGVTTHRVFFPA